MIGNSKGIKMRLTYYPEQRERTEGWGFFIMGKEIHVEGERRKFLAGKSLR